MNKLLPGRMFNTKLLLFMIVSCIDQLFHHNCVRCDLCNTDPYITRYYVIECSVREQCNTVVIIALHGQIQLILLLIHVIFGRIHARCLLTYYKYS